MFDIGFSELLLIAVVALVVLGPERLPKAARFAGLWVRRARAQWYSVRAELENELADEELRRSLKATQEELRAMRADMQAQGQALQADVAGLEARGRADATAPGPTPAAGTLAGDVGVHVGSEVPASGASGATVTHAPSLQPGSTGLPPSPPNPPLEGEGLSAHRSGTDAVGAGTTRRMFDGAVDGDDAGDSGVRDDRA